MKFGPDEGNRFAIVRWGKYLDKGVWIHLAPRGRRWKWTRHDDGERYVRCLFFDVRFGGK